MKSEDVWGSLDDRWTPALPMSKNKRYVWRSLAVVCMVLVFGACSITPSMSPWLAGLVETATETCEEAVELPLESRCSQTAWTACENARVWWETAREGREVFWPSDNGAIFYPKEFLCRSAHMAELAELAAILADTYGDEFWEIEGDFWPLRFYMTYTPWSDLQIYFSLYSSPTADSITFNYLSARWLDHVRDSQGMSDSSVRLLNSLLSRVSEFTNTYDSLPSANNISKKELREIKEEIASAYWPTNLFLGTFLRFNNFLSRPWEIPGTDSGTAQQCREALIDARTNQPDWETNIELCKTCPNTPAESTCQALSVLAELEYKWQKLPKICANTQPTNTPDDSCRNAALDICTTNAINDTAGMYLYPRLTDMQNAANDNLGEYLYRRLTDIVEGSCVLATPLADMLSEAPDSAEKDTASQDWVVR